MKADNDEKLDLEYYKGIHKGLLEFIDLIDSMKELSGRNLIITFVSGMVGYSCQALVHEKKENYILISTKTKKQYITGDSLDYYLFDAKHSLYNFVMGDCIQRCSFFEIPKIQPLINRVAKNLGNDEYLIQHIFNPEKIFDFELYRSTWNKFYNTLTNYCKKAEEWPIIFCLALCHYLDEIYNEFGKESYCFFLYIALENAINVLRISQK
jgi:hypothetical protein